MGIWLYRRDNILRVLYHVLVGFHTGLVLALLCAQWTWLELRVNTGMLILLGCLLGPVYGLRKNAGRPLLRGSFAVLAVLGAGLLITQGDVAAMRILVGAMVREGMFLPDLSLQGAELIFRGLGLLTILVAAVYSRAAAKKVK